MVWGTWNRGRMWDNRTKLLHTQGGVRRTSVWCVSKWWDMVHLHFAWNFRVRFLEQMEQFISSGKIGSKYDAVPFVKNDPVELSRLVRFLQMVQLIPIISVETKKEELPSKAFLLFWKMFTGLNRSIWHFIRKKRFFGTNGKRPRCPWPFTSVFASYSIFWITATRQSPVRLVFFDTVAF